MFYRLIGVGLIALCCVSCSPRTSSPSAGGLEHHPAHFRAFIVLNNYHQQLFDFEQALRRARVAGVVPVSQLWLQGSEWRAREHSAYAMPAAEQWPAMIKTLRFVKLELLPLLGPIEVLSGFRTPAYNLAAGGATRSRHLAFSALDLKPRRNIRRSALHARLLKLWRTRGEQWDLGLGLYSGQRLHVDTGGYRTW